MNMQTDPSVSCREEDTLHKPKKKEEIEERDIDGASNVVCLVFEDGEVYILLVFKDGNSKRLFLPGGKRTASFDSEGNLLRKESPKETVMREALQEIGVVLNEEDLFRTGRRKLSPSSGSDSCYQYFFITVVRDDSKLEKSEIENIKLVSPRQLYNVLIKRVPLNRMHWEYLVLSLHKIIKKINAEGINSESYFISDLAFFLQGNADCAHSFAQIMLEVEKLMKRKQKRIYI